MTLKKSIFLVLSIIAILSIMFFFGVPLGILFENPDGFKRVLINQKGELWRGNLISP